jgi:hypothetical protein
MTKLMTLISLGSGLIGITNSQFAASSCPARHFLLKYTKVYQLIPEVIPMRISAIKRHVLPIGVGKVWGRMGQINPCRSPYYLPHHILGWMIL